jgi:DNA-directed RNA polymerase specialized sigma24 family protein
MERVRRPARITAQNRITAMTHAYERAVQEIQGSSDPERRYAEATLLAAELVRLAQEAGALRAEAAREIAQREGISHRELAKRLGISPTMADRLLRRARDNDADQVDDDPADPVSTDR